MAIWLERDPAIVDRLRSDNFGIGHATSKILFSFYRTASPTKRWASLKGALLQLERENDIMELGLDELQAEAEKQSGTLN